MSCLLLIITNFHDQNSLQKGDSRNYSKQLELSFAHAEDM